MNLVVITGNLGKDAEKKMVGDSPACSFSVAVRTGKDKPSIWFNCTYFSNWAHEKADRLRKGTRVTLSARLSAYQNKEGQTVPTLVVSDIEIAADRSAPSASDSSASDDGFTENPF